MTYKPSVGFISTTVLACRPVVLRMTTLIFPLDGNFAASCLVCTASSPFILSPSVTLPLFFSILSSLSVIPSSSFSATISFLETFFGGDATGLSATANCTDFDGIALTSATATVTVAVAAGVRI